MATPVKGHLELKTEKLGRGIFKPLSFFSSGYSTVPYNEVLAYRISELFQFDIVPRTALKKVRVEIGEEKKVLKGSFQEYVEGIPLNAYLKENDREEFINDEFIAQQVTHMFVFDIFIANLDRVLENVIINPETMALHAIENGFSLGFNLATELDARGRDWFYEPYSLEEEAKMDYPEILSEAVDEEYLDDVVQHTNRNRITQTDEEEFYEDEDQRDNVYSLIRYRKKYLPRIMYKQ